jgi:putative phosphoesterase
MATRLLVVADTHVPKRARELPAQVWNEVESADLVIHAGDWVDESLLDELEARARRLVAVWGNNDHGGFRERLPEVARIECEGVRIGVIHETGAATGREQRCSAQFRRQPHCTYVTATADDGQLRDVTFHTVSR